MPSGVRTVLVGLAAAIIFAASAQAKLAQYQPKDSGVHYLVQAVKLNTAPAHSTGLPALVKSVTIAPPLVVTSKAAVPEVCFIPDPVFRFPFDSRPPPLPFNASFAN